MQTGLLYAAVILSFAISLATLRSPSFWWLQVFAGALLLALDYWLPLVIGLITSAIAIAQIGRGFVLYRRSRTARVATLIPAPDAP
jgi:hypothetical protein